MEIKKESNFLETSNDKATITKNTNCNRNSTSRIQDSILTRISTPLYLRKILNQDSNLENEITSVQNKLQSNKTLGFNLKNEFANLIEKPKIQKNLKNRKSLDENNIKAHVLSSVKNPKLLGKYGSELNLKSEKNSSQKNIILTEKTKDQTKSPITDRPKSERKINQAAKRINKKMSENYNPVLKTIAEEGKEKRHNSICVNDDLGKSILSLNLLVSVDPNVFKGKVDEYLISKEIGKGSYAVVKKAVHKPTQTKCAIKFYDKSNFNDIQKKNSVKREIEILKKIDHKNLVKLYEVIETPKQILIVMDLIEGDSLLNHIRAKPSRRIEENEAKLIFQQVIEGLSYCHSMNIFHRDIKLENIIIDDKKKVKIIDFGFGVNCPKEKLLNFFCGTPSYMPPEIVQKKDYLGHSADIWSSGILFYTLLVGNFPFRGLSERELYNKIVKGAFNVPTYISIEVKSLIKKILNPLPALRLSTIDILSMLNRKNNCKSEIV